MPAGGEVDIRALFRIPGIKRFGRNGGAGYGRIEQGPIARGHCGLEECFACEHIGRRDLSQLGQGIIGERESFTNTHLFLYRSVAGILL